MPVLMSGRSIRGNMHCVVGNVRSAPEHVVRDRNFTSTSRQASYLDDRQAERLAAPDRARRAFGSDLEQRVGAVIDDDRLAGQRAVAVERKLHDRRRDPWPRRRRPAGSSTPISWARKASISLCDSSGALAVGGAERRRRVDQRAGHGLALRRALVEQRGLDPSRSNLFSSRFLASSPLRFFALAASSRFFASSRFLASSAFLGFFLLFRLFPLEGLGDRIGLGLLRLGFRLGWLRAGGCGGGLAPRGLGGAGLGSGLLGAGGGAAAAALISGLSRRLWRSDLRRRCLRLADLVGDRLRLGDACGAVFEPGRELREFASPKSRRRRPNRPATCRAACAENDTRPDASTQAVGDRRYGVAGPSSVAFRAPARPRLPGRPGGTRPTTAAPSPASPCRNPPCGRRAHRCARHSRRARRSPP